MYFCDFYSDGIPAPTVTYSRRELFACNNAAGSGGKLPQPLFDAIKDNGICAVTRGCRAGRNCNRQRPVIGRRPDFRPTFHHRGVNNNNIIHVKLSTCQIVGNDYYTNVALINARSVKNKTLVINEEIIQHDWDILAITETWLKQTGDEAIVTELLPPGYTFHHVARSRGRGGGVAVVYRNTYNTEILPKLHFTTIELIRLQFTNPFLLKYNLWVVYHPPATSKTSGTLSDFYSELEQLFTEASISVIPTVIDGDFNVHFDDTLKSEPLRTLLESYNLTQHVHSPTHQTGHILDLVVSQTDDNFITSVIVHPDSLSDHHRIELKLRALKPAVQTNTITKREFRNIDANALRSDITSVCSDMCASTS